MKSTRQTIFLAIPLTLLFAFAPPRQALCAQSEPFVAIPAAITAFVFASATYRMTTDYVAPLYNKFGLDSIVQVLNVPFAFVSAVTIGVVTYRFSKDRIR